MRNRYLRDLNVVVADLRHPDKGAGRQSKGEDLGQAEAHALEHEKLTGKVTEGHHVGPDRNVINWANVQIVRSIATNNRRDDSPGAEKSTGERSHLILCLGVVCRGRD